MKKLQLIMLLFFVTTGAQAQIIGELFNQKKTQIKYLTAQIAALKVYTEYLQKGYQIAKEGLTLIGDIKDKDFSMHKDYFASLRKISPAVGGYTRVKDIVALQVRTYHAYLRYYNRARESGMFTKQEVDYILGVYIRVLEDCSGLMDELIVLTTADSLAMKDDERIIRIDRLFAGMQSNYTFAQDFGKQALMLAASRKTDIHSASAMRALHGLND